MRPGSVANEVQADLRRRITSGEYQPGAKLPRLQELMEEYGVRSRSAMDRVIRALVAEGLLTAVQGSGIYVRQRHVVRRDLVAGLRLEHERATSGSPDGSGLFEAMTGEHAVDVVTRYSWVGAPQRVAEMLEVNPGAPMLERTFHWAVAGAPHQITMSYMSADLARAAGLTDPTCERPGVGTMMQLHRAGVPVSKAMVTLETRMPSAREREDLTIPPGTPVYEHWRVMFSDDQPVEAGNAIVPGDRIAYVFNVDFAEGQ